MEFNLLVQDSTRSDDYVNATKWCKYFNKMWAEFKRLPEVRKWLAAFTSKHGNIPPFETRSGKGGGTYVHPLVAIKLAEWLSPEFDIYVKETFKRYLEGDVDLAVEILERAKPEDVAKSRERIEGTPVETKL
ncbi:hypothetical protein B4U84_24320 [Westiellopsis prolifica IICB1]|nr:hypothetical protein B4U84_24320 [Westiellopsis prolifica IICB1]